MTDHSESIQHWVKMGRIFDPCASCEKGFTHASNPVLLTSKNSSCEIVYNSRDVNGRSHVFRGYFNIDNPLESFFSEPLPVLSPGCPGSFDDHGVTATSAFRDDRGQLFIFYVGWNRCSDIPFRNALGLARVDSSGSIERVFKGPLLDRSIHDPCFIASACAIKLAEQYLLYYTSGEEWMVDEACIFHPKYRIKIATSIDISAWDRRGAVAIDYPDSQELCITSPSVISEGGLHRMWFSYRHTVYRIGYAESLDGIVWTRNDSLVNLRPSGENDWDSAAVCYPNVFRIANSLYMLYNGNSYGETGFGLAVLKKGTE